MFNRRFLRVKVLQGLYAYYQGGSEAVGKSLNELHLSIERSFDLVLYLFSLPLELDDFIELKIQDLRDKSKAAQDDLELNRRFQNNAVLSAFKDSDIFQKLLKERKIGWTDQQETIGRLLKEIRAWDRYDAYLKNDKNDYKSDQEFIISLFKEIVAEFELLSHVFQEKSIYWDEENFQYALFIVISAYKKLAKGRKVDEFIQPVYENKEDKEFVELLFRRTIEQNDELQGYIMSKTQNWDSERIAMMDMLLMKMAIAEIIEFKMIPVKVSMNEYIDISKSFSSPKSGQFINGILDKVILELREKKKFKKIGRGLIE